MRKQTESDNKPPIKRFFNAADLIRARVRAETIKLALGIGVKIGQPIAFSRNGKYENS